jgi:N-succinyldiaminopimelate aminotransferase
MKLSVRAQQIAQSEIRVMSIECERVGGINLAQGVCDTPVPVEVRQAAENAIEAGHNSYTRLDGVGPLRQQIACKMRTFNKIECDAEREIVVTAGSTGAFYCACLALLNPGDEVILFEPYYDSYKPSVRMAGAVPRIVTLYGPDWHFSPDELKAAFTPRTKAILINTPHNPTGKVFHFSELETIANLCIEHDVVCITDEVYEHLVYDGKHIPMASVKGMRDRTITISSFGKTFSLTGWKIGWAGAPPPLTEAIRSTHQFITFSTATPLQYGAAAALEAPLEYYAELCSSYKAKRDFLVDALKRIGFKVSVPAGAYFVCADFRMFGFEDDITFCRHLIYEIGVAAIPPTFFYDNTQHGRSYVRFAFCKRQESLENAVKRLEKLWK